MKRKCGVNVNNPSGGRLFADRERSGEQVCDAILRYINPKTFFCDGTCAKYSSSKNKIHTVNNCAMHTDKTNPTSDHNDLKHSGFMRPSRSIFSVVNPNPLSVSVKEPSNEP